jgi:hypothetical protein
MSIATQPGHTALTRMLTSRSSPASVRVSAFKAALVTWYAGEPAPMLASDPDSDETLTIRADRPLRSSGRNAWPPCLPCGKGDVTGSGSAFDFEKGGHLALAITFREANRNKRVARAPTTSRNERNNDGRNPSKRSGHPIFGNST